MYETSLLVKFTVLLINKTIKTCTSYYMLFNTKTVCIAIFLCLIGGYTVADAQILNVERTRGSADSTGWGAELGFDFTINKYRERVITGESESTLTYTSNLNRYIFLSSLEFVDIDGASVINSGYLHLRSTFLYDNSFSPELFAQYQYNNNLGLDSRMLAGGGIRYRFISLDTFTGTFSTGIMAEHEEWKPVEDDLVKNTFLKTTSNVALRGNVSEQATLLVIGYYQARPVDFFKPRATFESQLNVRLSRHVALAVSFVLTNDADPIIDIPKLTYELKNGLLITF